MRSASARIPSVLQSVTDARLPQVNGLSAFATGLAFVPMMGAVLPVNLIAPRVTERIGAPATIAAGATQPASCVSTPVSLFAADANVPVYNPPSRGAPGGRIGGGTRGGGQNVFVLSVLAPDHSAFTTSEQPSLYWFISNPTSRILYIDESFNFSCSDSEWNWSG